MIRLTFRFQERGGVWKYLKQGETTGCFYESQHAVTIGCIGGGAHGNKECDIRTSYQEGPISGQFGRESYGDKAGRIALGKWCLSYNRTKLDETQ